MDAAPSAGTFAAPRLARVRTVTVRQPFLFAVLALLGLGAVVVARVDFVQDGWLTLTTGRYVAQHGIPHTDGWTLMAHGRRWIDQQWLAQLAFYGASAAGGLKAAVLAAALAVELALALGIRAALRAGASPLAAAAAAVLAVVAAPYMLELRAQSLAVPLFVLLYAQLAADSRGPSARVLVCLPVLVLWANLHGSVLLAAGLVLVRAAGRALAAPRLSRAENLRTALLALGAPAALLCTPYGLAVVGYYRTILTGNDFSRWVVEWQHTTLGPGTAAFFVLAGLVAFRAGRVPGKLTRFEQVALVLLFASGLDALRNTLWFALAALVSLPLLLGGAAVRPQRERERRVQLGVGAVALVAAAAAAFAPLAHVPTHVGRTVAALVREDPSLRVFPDAYWADWLLWAHPGLAGRISIDARYELLTAQELRALALLPGDRETSLTKGYRLFVVDGRHDAALRYGLLHGRHGRVVARDRQVEAILLPRA